MQPQSPSMLEMLTPFIAIFAIFYFLIIRPQSKRIKQQNQLLGGLKRGDAVVMNSGVLGTIDGLTDHVVTLEIANGVKVKFLKKQIAGLQSTLLNNPSTQK